MQQLIEQLAGPEPYLIFFLLFLATGFGLPLPEDIPLLVAGYMCGAAAGQHHPYLHIMLPVCFVAILGSDLVLYTAGRHFGRRMLRWPVVGRVLSRKRLLRAELEILKHGGKFVFVARFLPGLRAPAFFASGVFKVPVLRFLLYDGLAAALSVPLIMALGFIFHAELEEARKRIAEGQRFAVGAAIGLVVLFLVVKFIGIKRGASVDEADLERQLAEEMSKAGRKPEMVTPSASEFGGGSADLDVEAEGDAEKPS